MAKVVLPFGRHVIFIVLIIVILSVMSFTVFVALRTNIVEEVLETDQIIKLLLVVEDGGEAMSTTILTYYPVSQRGALIDILGNTGGIYSSLGRVDRLDAVYEERGIDVYRAEIETLVDMTIPFSIEIGLDDFAVLTDRLGGLDVSVQSPIDDVINGVYYLLPSGQIKLDGDKVVTYLTYEGELEDSSDKEFRARNTIVAFFKALGENANDIFNDDTFKYYEDHMRANIDSRDFYNLLETISHVDAERLFPQVITGSERSVDGETLLFPYNDGQLIKDVLQQTVLALVSEATFSRVYALEIQNGTTIQGLARNTSSLLRSTGYDVVSTINADRNDHEETFIIDHIGNEEVAKALGDFIRCTNIVQPEVDTTVSESNRLVDYTIVLGTDFDGRYVR